MSDEPREPMTQHEWEEEINNVIASMPPRLNKAIVRLRAERESLIQENEDLKNWVDRLLAEVVEPTGVDRG